MRIRKAIAACAAVVEVSFVFATAHAQDIAPSATETPSPTPEPSGTIEATLVPTSTLSVVPKPAATPVPSPTPIFVGSVTAIGDSVMLGAARVLRHTIANLDVDARVSRQANAAIRLIQARHDSGRLGEVIIVHIGNNGPITTTQFDRLMSPLKDAHLVLVVNLRVPRFWEASNNQVLAEGVKRYPNTVLIDWNGYTRANPGLVGGDGIHLGARSARAYTALMVDALTSPLPVPSVTPEGPQDISP